MAKKFSCSSNKHLQVNCILLLHVRWMALDSSADLTLNLNGITLFAADLPFID